MHFMKLFLLVIGVVVRCCDANRYADQLYEDLLYMYQKGVRPVKNASDVLVVNFGASLIRLIDVNERSQVLTTNLWLEMQWRDFTLVWDPNAYGGLTKLHLPSDQIWTPDILLYNNAEGDYPITILVDALVYYDGTVLWKPPAIYKSFCSINIEFFPYDVQNCTMKFGAWTYNGFYVDMKQIPVYEGDIPEEIFDEDGDPAQYLEFGMDLSYFYKSAEWDLMKLSSARHDKLYPGCCGQEKYIDITFELILRRKPLFYTVNLVIPCMLIAILTTFVFYLPSESRHKITFAISILVTLTVFFLVLIDLIPPTSLVMPLIGKYLLFTMMLVGVSIFVTVLTLNVYNRNGSTHKMPSWIKVLFLEILPKPLCIQLPMAVADEEDDTSCDSRSISSISDYSGLSAKRKASIMSRRPSPYFLNVAEARDTQMRLTQLAQLRGMHPDVIRRMIHNVNYISEYYRGLDQEDQVSKDWSYVAMIIDRLFLIIFTVVNMLGTFLIIAQAPSVWDTSMPLAIPPPSKPLGGDTLGQLFINVTSAPPQ